MVWFKRGAGRNYNSLSCGCLFGYFTKKIIDYGCGIRKCKKFDLEHSPTDHDFHLIFAGAAKGMESDLAASLT